MSRVCTAARAAGNRGVRACVHRGTRLSHGLSKIRATAGRARPRCSRGSESSLLAPRTIPARRISALSDPKGAASHAHGESGADLRSPAAVQRGARNEGLHGRRQSTSPMYAGGMPSSSGRNAYALSVSNPAKTYYLNAGTTALYCTLLDYTATLTAQGNATITLSADPFECSSAEKPERRRTPIVVPGILPPGSGLRGAVHPDRRAVRGAYSLGSYLPMSARLTPRKISPT